MQCKQLQCNKAKLLEPASVNGLHIHRNLEKRRSIRRKLRAGCSKAEPKIFAPPQAPSPGAQDSQNLISWRWSLYGGTENAGVENAGVEISARNSKKRQGVENVGVEMSAR